MAELDRVCVFLGSSTGGNPLNTEATIAMAEALVERELGLVYGGSDAGLMGILADAVLARGGEVIGVIPHNVFTREVAHRGLTELIEVDGMHARKATMVELSDAFAALPGGLGTLDELAEVTTWRQIGIHRKPVGVVNAGGYFTPLLGWMDRAVADGLLTEPNRAMVHVADSPSELLDRFATDDGSTSPKWGV